MKNNVEPAKRGSKTRSNWINTWRNSIQTLGNRSKEWRRPPGWLHYMGALSVDRSLSSIISYKTIDKGSTQPSNEMRPSKSSRHTYVLGAGRDTGIRVHWGYMATGVARVWWQKLVTQNQRWSNSTPLPTYPWGKRLKNQRTAYQTCPINISWMMISGNLSDSPCWERTPYPPTRKDQQRIDSLKQSRKAWRYGFAKLLISHETGTSGNRQIGWRRRNWCKRSNS